MSGWSAFLMYLLYTAQVLLGGFIASIFGAYAAMAVRRISVRPDRDLVRLAWACAAAGIAGVLLTGLVASNINFILMSNRVFYVPLVMLCPSLILSVLMRWVIGSWQLSLAPMAALGLASVVFALVWSEGQSSAGDLLSLGVGLPVWHLSCALLLWHRVRHHSKGLETRRANICCSACGYALTGLASPTQCPECGARFA